MKKFAALLLAIVMVLSIAACTPAEGTKPSNNPSTTQKPEAPKPSDPNPTDPNPTDPKPTDPKPSDVMTYEEYANADIGSKVTIETYVQAKQGWWEDKIILYTQDHDGGYFIYNMAISEADAAKLVPGTKIRVTGFKDEFSGEVEIIDVESWEILEGSYIAEPQDLTALLSNEAELIKKQNVLATFKGLTIEAIKYKNNEPGDDIYVTVSQDGKSYDFCVEVYLTGPDTDVYKAFAELKTGDVVDITGFVYWYNGINTHITAVEPGSEVKGEGVMTYDEYVAAPLDTEVTIETYVQAKQGWWENKIILYTQDHDGGYFVYNMGCTQEDADKLVPGTKIRITGFKADYAGEVEIVDVKSWEIMEGSYIAEPQDLTDILANEDELIKKQNVLATFKGLTIEEINYKNNEPGDDIYVTVSLDGKSYEFCVEVYLTGTDTDVYKAFAELKAGDKVDITGFVYWYNAINTHITGVTKI